MLISMATSSTGALLWSVAPPSPPPFFLFLPEKWYYHYEICNSASRVVGEGRGIKSYVQGFYDNCPWYSSDWWLWDVTLHPTNTHPTAHPTPISFQIQPWTLCLYWENETCGGGGSLISKGCKKRQFEKEKKTRSYFFKAFSMLFVLRGTEKKY